MSPTKLISLNWATVLGFLLISHYSTLTASQDITISGFFPVTEPVSVLGANPAATTVVGTRTVGYDGITTIPSLLTTITETAVFGPSTAAITARFPDNSVTTTCILTRSLSRGLCSYVNTVLVGAGTSYLVTNYETYLLESTVFDLQASYTVTAGQGKLLLGNATTTSSALLTNSASLTGSILSTASTPSTPPTSSPTTNPSTSATSTSLASVSLSTNAPATTASTLPTSSYTTTGPAPTRNFPSTTSSVVSAISLSTNHNASSSSTAPTTTSALATPSTGSPALITANRAARGCDTRYLSNTVLCLVGGVIIALLQHL